MNPADAAMNPYTVTRASDEHVVLELVGELTIEHVRGLHAALSAGAGIPRRLEIHCAELTRLDAAAVQLLFAATRAAAEVLVPERSDVWSNAFARYGLTEPSHSAS